MTGAAGLATVWVYASDYNGIECVYCVCMVARHWQVQRNTTSRQRRPLQFISLSRSLKRCTDLFGNLQFGIGNYQVWRMKVEDFPMRAFKNCMMAMWWPVWSFGRVLCPTGQSQLVCGCCCCCSIRVSWTSQHCIVASVQSWQRMCCRTMDTGRDGRMQYTRVHWSINDFPSKTIPHLNKQHTYPQTHTLAHMLCRLWCDL